MLLLASGSRMLILYILRSWCNNEVVWLYVRYLSRLEFSTRLFYLEINSLGYCFGSFNRDFDECLRNIACGTIVQLTKYAISDRSHYLHIFM